MKKNITLSVLLAALFLTSVDVISAEPATFQPRCVSLKYSFGTINNPESFQDLQNKLMNVMFGDHRGPSDLVGKLFNFIKEMREAFFAGSDLIVAATTSPNDLVQAAETVTTAIATEGLQSEIVSEAEQRNVLSLIYTVTIHDVSDETELNKLAALMQDFVDAVNGETASATDVATLFEYIFESISNITSATVATALHPGK